MPETVVAPPPDVLMLARAATAEAKAASVTLHRLYLTARRAHEAQQRRIDVAEALVARLAVELDGLARELDR